MNRSLKRILVPAALFTAFAILLAACAVAPPPRPEPQPQPAEESELVREMAPPSPAPSLAKSAVSPSAATAGAPPPPTGTVTAGAPQPADAQDQAADTSTEEYGTFQENPFKRTAEETLSTFAADVDTASWSNMRRFITEGSLPPVDSIRIEEMLNYFDYGWAEPSGTVPIAVSSESADAPWSPDHRLLAIGLRTRSISAENLPPANIVFLVDTSGSMGDPQKLPLVKRAFSLLAETMRPQDRVALVAYAGSAGVVLPPTAGSQKGAILAALESLESGGSTAGGAGITLAYQTALQNFRKGGNNRVVLATDGDFNVGISSDAELEKLIGSWKDKGIFLSVLGFGSGNYKDTHMETLADKGNGNYAYIDSLQEARRVLVEELGATLLTVAKDVKIQVEFDPATVAGWRLIGYENRLLAARDFADDTKDAGEMGAGHRVTALYEIETAPGADPGASAGIVRIRYKKPDGDQSSLLEFPLEGGAGPAAAASSDFRFAAAVTAAGMILRGSKYGGQADWKLVLDLARGSSGESDRRKEFVTLAEKASKMRR